MVDGVGDGCSEFMVLQSCYSKLKLMFAYVAYVALGSNGCCRFARRVFGCQPNVVSFNAASSACEKVLNPPFGCRFCTKSVNNIFGTGDGIMLRQKHQISQ